MQTSSSGLIRYLKHLSDSEKALIQAGMIAVEVGEFDLENIDHVQVILDLCAPLGLSAKFSARPDGMGGVDTKGQIRRRIL